MLTMSSNFVACALTPSLLPSLLSIALVYTNCAPLDLTWPLYNVVLCCVVALLIRSHPH